MTGVSVKILCNFAARRGDLDHRYTPSPSALEGMEGHRIVAGRRGPGHLAELTLSGQCRGLAISGRADGYDPERHLLEEIKTHRGDIARINPGLRALHWAQLKVYGALLCRQQGLATVALRLVYYNIHSGRETAEEEAFPAHELWLFLEELCIAYGAWARQEDHHRRQRDQQLAALVFPFAGFRSGQRQLSEAAYRALMGNRRLLLEAPTGIGKTVGALFPALTAMPRKPLDRLFYLSSRNTGRALALEGMALILRHQPAPLALRVLALGAREQACVHPDKACHGESCPLAKGFYDRLPQARKAAVDRGGILDHSTVAEIAASHGLCPYFLTQELARWADVVIGDVNYCFDQHAMLHALSQENRWQSALLVDEAHNLPDRARAMYSISLSQQHLLAVRRHAPGALHKPLSALARAWRELARHHLAEGDAALLLDQVPTELMAALNRVVSAIIDYLTDHQGDVELQNLMFEAIGFLRLAETFGEHSVCELARDGIGRATLAIHNLIPADFLAPRFATCAGAVLFSATLSPQGFYRDLLGLPADSHFLRVESPFSRHQLQVHCHTAISTRLKDRDASIAPVASRITERYRARPGNVLVYLSSFAYLEALHAACSALAPEIPLRRQTPGMDETARRAFLDSFRAGGGQVAFAVLGGVFSEGIDLPGSRLDGVFVLTLGLPPHDRLHEVLRQRMDRRFGQGYEYTYLYPGLRKVVQAAGRLIRTPEDRGFIELIDDRFARPAVRALLPGWWPEPDFS